MRQYFCTELIDSHSVWFMWDSLQGMILKFLGYCNYSAQWDRNKIFALSLINHTGCTGLICELSSPLCGRGDEYMEHGIIDELFFLYVIGWMLFLVHWPHAGDVDRG